MTGTDRGRPGPGTGRKELRLVATAVVAVTALALPLGAVAGMLHGRAGVRGTLAGLVLVLVLFGAAALLHALVARCSPGTFLAVTATGIGVRLGVYAAGLAWLTGLPDLHGTSLAAATAAGIAGTMVAEMVTIARTPQLHWVQTAPRQGAPTT